MASFAPINSYYDFSGISSLRAEAVSGEKTDYLVERVGIEFESAFFKLLLEEMQKASEPLKSELSASDTMDQYQSMFNEEVAHFMASRQSLGISNWIRRQLGEQQFTNGEQSGKD